MNMSIIYLLARSHQISTEYRNIFSNSKSYRRNGNKSLSKVNDRSIPLDGIFQTQWPKKWSIASRTAAADKKEMGEENFLCTQLQDCMFWDSQQARQSLWQEVAVLRNAYSIGFVVH